MDVLMLRYDARPSLPQNLSIRSSLAVPKEILSASVIDSVLNDSDCINPFDYF